jgi:DHA1 family multidrug resistance protein-like MFS transporter
LLSLGVVVIGDLFSGSRRRWAMGLNMAGLTMTTTVAPIIGGLLAEGGAFRPFLVFAAAGPMWFAVRNLPGRPDAPTAAPPMRHLRSAIGVLRSRGRLSDFVGVLPVSFLTLATFAGLVITVMPLYLDQVFSLTVSQRGLVQAIGSATSSTASALSGRVGSRFTPARVVTAAFALMATGLVIIGVAPNLWVLGAGLAVTGSGSGSIWPLLQDFSASVGPAEYRGVLVGSWVSANRLGQTLGPTAGSAIAESVGPRAAYLAGAGLMTAVLLVWSPARHRARRLSGRRAGG